MVEDSFSLEEDWIKILFTLNHWKVLCLFLIYYTHHHSTILLLIFCVNKKNRVDKIYIVKHLHEKWCIKLFKPIIIISYKLSYINRYLIINKLYQIKFFWGVINTKIKLIWKWKSKIKEFGYPPLHLPSNISISWSLIILLIMIQIC